MAPARAETEAQRAALLAAAWNRAQFATRGIGASAQEQMQQQTMTDTEEAAAIQGQLTMAQAQARMAVVAAPGGELGAEEHEKQESAFQERLLQYPSALALQRSIQAALTGVGIIWTIIYANFHALGRMFKKRYFCAFGDEWTFAKTPPTTEGKAPPIPSGLTKAIGWCEILALVIIDLLIFLAILQQFLLTALIVSAIIHPFETFKMLWSVAFELLWHLLNP